MFHPNPNPNLLNMCLSLLDVLAIADLIMSLSNTVKSCEIVCAESFQSKM